MSGKFDLLFRVSLFTLTITMMKYTLHSCPRIILLASFLCLFSFPIAADARIGESRSALESRILRSGAVVYRDDDLEQRRHRGMPYMKYIELLPRPVDTRIYFKTADGRNPNSSELEERGNLVGWDLHVVYVEGKSAIEVYKRSQSMSEFEFNALLGVVAEGSYWKRLEKEEKADMVSAFDVDMVRSDGAVRAKKLGRDSLLLVSPEIDEHLLKMNTEQLQESAPVSVKGF